MFAFLITNKVTYTDSIKVRASQLHAEGIDIFDSLHIASAEELGADVILTTDDRLQKKAKTISHLKVKVENPVIWLMEVTRYERKAGLESLTKELGPLGMAYFLRQYDLEEL